MRGPHEGGADDVEEASGKGVAEEDDVARCVVEVGGTFSWVAVTSGKEGWERGSSNSSPGEVRRESAPNGILPDNTLSIDRWTFKMGFRDGEAGIGGAEQPFEVDATDSATQLWRRSAMAC